MKPGDIGGNGKNAKGSGRWRNTAGYRADVDHAAITRKFRSMRPMGNAFLAQLTLDREIRICIRYLSDDDYRLTKISEEVRSRPANVRNMLAFYGIDIRNRVLIEKSA
jgi:hypothetical protein